MLWLLDFSKRKQPGPIHSIPALLLFVLAAGVAGADDAEFKAVTFVEKMGGSVQRAASLSGQPVVAANLYGSPVLDGDLEALTGLARLKRLNLSYTKITDKGLKELTRLGNLHVLSLAGTSVTAAGLKELAALNDLQTLDLSGVRITEAGLQALANCKNLRTLYLTSSLAPGLAALQKALPRCEIILPLPSGER